MQSKKDRRHYPIDVDFLEKRPDVKAIRANVLVAFGDISGFRDWTKLPIVSPEKFAKFMVRVYEKFVIFRNGSGYFIKNMGDGLMAVSELTEDPKESFEQVWKMLKHSNALAWSIGELIRDLSYPQPGGFRIRIVAGDVLRVEALQNKGSCRKQIDYIGYPINLASSLLDVERGIPCVCHETVKEIATHDRRHATEIQFSRLKEQTYCPKGVAPEDLQALWKFEMKSK